MGTKNPPKFFLEGFCLCFFISFFYCLPRSRGKIFVKRVYFFLARYRLIGDEINNSEESIYNFLIIVEIYLPRMDSIVADNSYGIQGFLNMLC